LQQAGSRFFSFTPSRTMRIAQNLYEGVDFGDGPTGLITYMRTDSVSIAKQAQEEALAFIAETYGDEYVPSKPNTYKSRGSAQEAHEAIRPTDVTRKPEDLSKVLKPEELKLYRIIWERFVASQMAPAKIAQKTVEIDADGTTDSPVRYLFRVSASEVTFPGYMKVTGDEEKKKAKKAKEENGDESGKVDETVEKLPPLEKGETVDLLEWLSEQKFTQPPGRYTEASLVRALEENGVGRPSTYASILSTLQDRSYVEKEKRSLRPTDLGTQVNTFLVEHLGDLFNVSFTAEMEESLDKIESGSVEWTQMLGEFYGSFEEWIKKVKGPDAKPELVQALLDATKDVKEWGPEVKRGKRTYSDEKFIESVQKQLDKGEKAISSRQLAAVKKIVCRYHDQLPGLDDRVEELGLAETMEEAKKPVEPPREATQKKLDLLKEVTFAEPRKVGKRTYDDEAFTESLRQQVETGKRLSVNQIRYLDKLVLKYSDQIADFDSMKEELGVEQSQEPHHEETGPLLELFNKVTDWKPAVQRGKREWDDKKFYDSLSSQFKERKELSFRQVASLKKMAKRYADQIPDYDQLVEKYGLPERKKKKTAAE
jgi:DNA topoisomerase-1